MENATETDSKMLKRYKAHGNSVYKRVTETSNVWDVCMNCRNRAEAVLFAHKCNTLDAQARTVA